MEESKTKKIIVALVVLVVICVVEVVMIFVLNRNNHLSQGDGEVERTFPESMHTKEMEEINDLARAMTIDEAEELYETAIAEATTEESKSEARVEYGRYLLDNDEGERFIEQFNQVDIELLDPGYSILYYSALREYYASEGDEALSEEYNEKIRVVVENSDYAAGG